MTTQMQFTSDLFSLLLWVSALGLVLGLCAGLADLWLWMRARRASAARRVAWSQPDGRRVAVGTESIFHSKQAE
jgi:hypothetical protein